MTVKQLITRLQTFKPESEVVIVTDELLSCSEVLDVVGCEDVGKVTLVFDSALPIELPPGEPTG